MGFFDKVKGMANKLTGGGASVTVSVEGTTIKDVIKVNISATVKDAPIEVSKVYLWVKSVEKINIPKHEMPVNQNQQGGISIDKEVFIRQEYVVASAQNLEGGQTYNWSYEFTLSGANIMPTYFGKFVSHEWEFLAGLDAKGNDPDSGWVAHQLY
jgi:hypothetical protein